VTDVGEGVGLATGEGIPQRGYPRGGLHRLPVVRECVGCTGEAAELEGLVDVLDRCLV
jgi:hypothetical protein